LNQKLLESPTEWPEINLHKTTFKDSEVVSPVPEQSVQPQNNLLTTIVWIIAGTALTLTAIEFGGFSVRDFVENLTASKML